MSFTKEDLQECYENAFSTGYMEATRYNEPDSDELFKEWFKMNHSANILKDGN